VKRVTCNVLRRQVGWHAALVFVLASCTARHCAGTQLSQVTALPFIYWHSSKRASCKVVLSIKTRSRQVTVTQHILH